MFARTLTRSGLVGLTIVTVLAVAPQVAGAAGVHLSSAAGAARSRISVSSASCVGDAATFRTLDARLVVGPSHGAKLAGNATNFGAGPAELIVPDWADPGEPAAVEATCTSVDNQTLASTTAAYAPIPFDVLASGPRSTLDVSMSRSTFKVGQATNVSGAGCTEAGTQFAWTGAHAGSDLSGRSYPEAMWGAWGNIHATDPMGGFRGKATAESSVVEVEITNGQDPPHAQIAVSELVHPVSPGPHVAFTSCQHQDGTQLFAEPKILTLTPNPAVAQSDMVVVPNPPGLPHRIRLSGHGCTQGAVSVSVTLESLASIRASLRVGAGSSRLTPSDGQPTIHLRRRGVSASARTAPIGPSAGVTSSVGEASPLPSTTVIPDNSGNWSYETDVPFTEGFAGGQARCGDPSGSGFRYHAQGVRLGGGTGQGGVSGVPL